MSKKKIKRKNIFCGGKAEKVIRAVRLCSDGVRFLHGAGGINVQAERLLEAIRNAAK